MNPEQSTRPFLTAEQLRAFTDQHRTVRIYQDTPIPGEDLEAILYAARRAPTDATAQLYSLIRLVDKNLREQVAELSGNPHLAGAPEAFIVCGDLWRVARLLAHTGHPVGHYPHAGIHFAIGDAVLAGQTLLLSAELLGYQGCWVGGVLNAVSEISALLELPERVFPFAGLTLGRPAEQPTQRPRLAPELLIHQDRYHKPTPEELDWALSEMAPISRRGDWGRTLARYFAPGGTMEQRDGPLESFLRAQGLGR